MDARHFIAYVALAFVIIVVFIALLFLRVWLKPEPKREPHQRASGGKMYNHIYLHNEASDWKDPQGRKRSAEINEAIDEND